MAGVPSVWRSRGHDIYHIPYAYSSLFGPERQWNPVTAYDFFIANWKYSILLALLYALLIHLLERVMRERKAFDLRLVFIAWNTSLALFSTIGTIRVGEEFLHTLTTYPLLHSICYSVDPRSPAAFWICCFAFSKIAELMDTVFLVLRKRPLIFLHWYHHAVVLIFAAHSSLEFTAAARWFVMMNYFVHSLMYTYYAVASAGFRPPKWISMSITSLQTAQMILAVIISFAILGIKLSGRLCQQTYDNLLLSFAIYLSFAVLFMRFFHKAYLKPKSAQKEKYQ